MKLKLEIPNFNSASFLFELLDQLTNYTLLSEVKFVDRIEILCQN